MNCRTFAKRLFDYQDGTLTSAEKAEFELHRSGCERCAALIESEAQTAQVVRAAAGDARERLDASAATFILSAPRHQSRPSLLAGWRIPAAIAALLMIVLLIPPMARRLVSEGGGPLGPDSATGRDSWAEEIQVTYEPGLHAETTLISHDSGVTTIIEIHVSYQQ